VGVRSRITKKRETAAAAIINPATRSTRRVVFVIGRTIPSPEAGAPASRSPGMRGRDAGGGVSFRGRRVEGGGDAPAGGVFRHLSRNREGLPVRDETARKRARKQVPV